MLTCLGQILPRLKLSLSTAATFPATRNNVSHLIATTALGNQLTLVTENPDHFKRIPSLPVESWRAP